LWPLVLTGVLIATVMPMRGAVRAAYAGRRGAAWWLVATALAAQATYLGLQIHLFSADLAKFKPQGSSYASIYYTLVGADHAHVALGLLLDLWLLARLATGLTRYRLVGLRVVTFYWSFVAAVSVAVVLTQLSPAL
jgi:heme/copper-type cytochrome/quinol oxidase subunit 3